MDSSTGTSAWYWRGYARRLENLLADILTRWLHNPAHVSTGQVCPSDRFQLELMSTDGALIARDWPSCYSGNSLGLRQNATCVVGL
jgi:hypothetical protein